MFRAGIAYSQMELSGFITRRNAITLVAEAAATDQHGVHQAGRSSSSEELQDPLPANEAGMGHPGRTRQAMDAIAGFAIAQPYKKHGRILTLDVLPQARRSGLGSTLLLECEARLRQRGCAEVYLETAVDNGAALKLYHKLGYRILRTLPGYYQPPDSTPFSWAKSCRPRAKIALRLMRKSVIKTQLQHSKCTADPLWIAVDSGGTFTDCVWREGTQLRILKVFSTAGDRSQAISEAVVKTGHTGPVVLLHGTTVGTNALLERKGARVAFVTTAGFEDTIEIGRQNRPKLYDLLFERVPPLVERNMRFGVNERVATPVRFFGLPIAVSWRDWRPMFDLAERNRSLSLRCSHLPIR